MSRSVTVIGLLLALYTLPCFGQSSCEAEKTNLGKESPDRANQEMTGRDDSASDRKPFMSGSSPEQQEPLLSRTWRPASLAARHRICSFGWLDGGFSSIGNTSGLVTEAPVPNRFSNQLMLDAAWLAVERSTTQGLSWGFRVDFYAGSDAGLLRPLNFFGPQGRRWGTDFRQAYLLLHTPMLFRRGIDWTFGRINLPTGAETGLAPYQQLYSRGYFWIHDETGGTALLATLHANSTLDVVAGPVMGYGTTFLLRGRAPSYIGRILYHPAGKIKQQIIATVYSGPQPLAVAKGHIGSWQTLAELQFRRVWSNRTSQIFQAHYSTDANDPGNHYRSSSTSGAFMLTALRINRNVSLHTRLEWFADHSGMRTTIPGDYGEATVGFTLSLNSRLEIRPEIRGDFASQPSFGATLSSVTRRNQLSTGVELILKGRLF